MLVEPGDIVVHKSDEDDNGVVISRNMTSNTCRVFFFREQRAMSCYTPFLIIIIKVGHVAFGIDIPALQELDRTGKLSRNSLEHKRVRHVLGVLDTFAEG